MRREDGAQRRDRQEASQPSACRWTAGQGEGLLGPGSIWVQPEGKWELGLPRAKLWPREAWLSRAKEGLWQMRADQ